MLSSGDVPLRYVNLAVPLCFEGLIHAGLLIKENVSKNI